MEERLSKAGNRGPKDATEIRRRKLTDVVPLTSTMTPYTTTPTPPSLRVPGSVRTKPPRPRAFTRPRRKRRYGPAAKHRFCRRESPHTSAMEKNEKRHKPERNKRRLEKKSHRDDRWKTERDEQLAQIESTPTSSQAAAASRVPCLH